jgi:hypothetical protein
VTPCRARHHRDPFDARLPDPRDVLQDRALSRAEKLARLQHWRHDAQEIEVANEEGMRGHVAPSNLDAIQRALRELSA